MKIIVKKKGTGFRYKMINLSKKIYNYNYRNIVSFIYFYNERKRYNNCGKLSNDYKKRIKKYWRNYKINIGLKEFEFYKSKNDKEDVRYITKKVYHSIIEPYFNNIITAEVMANKNYLELFLRNANIPKAVIRKINGTLLDEEYKIIDKSTAINLISTQKEEMIFKPAIDTCGGNGISFFDSSIKENELNNILNRDNFIIQNVIKQHKELAKFNNTSLNTVRVLSFLYKDNVKILYMVLRVGKKGMRVDNASAGGFEVVVKSDSYFSDYIVTIDKKKVDEEIINRYRNIKMPFYEEIVNEVKRLHPFLAGCKLIGWDVAINDEGKPTIIEINTEDIGMTDASQPVNGPLFGNLTDEILSEIRNKKVV